MTVDEEWRPIGYEPSKEVSNLGRVRRVSDGRILSQFNLKGYRQVHVRKKGPKAQRLVHNLVAEAFIGPPPPNMVVNHENGVRHDNKATNLEYLTIRDNILHAREKLGQKPPKGGIAGNWSLTDADIAEMVKKRAQGVPLLDLALEFNCSIKHVSDVYLGKRRRLPLEGA